MAATVANCGRCFYGIMYPEGTRRCCRYAPQRTEAGQYPFVKVEDWEWCGDFAPQAPITPGAPVINSLSPTTAVHGTFNLTVTGQNFTADAVVLFDGIAQATTVVSFTSLTAVCTIGRGTRTVTVRTVAGDSNGVQFIVT